METSFVHFSQLLFFEQDIVPDLRWSAKSVASNFPSATIGKPTHSVSDRKQTFCKLWLQSCTISSMYPLSNFTSLSSKAFCVKTRSQNHHSGDACMLRLLMYVTYRVFAESFLEESLTSARGVWTPLRSRHQMSDVCSAAHHTKRNRRRSNISQNHPIWTRFRCELTRTIHKPFSLRTCWWTSSENPNLRRYWNSRRALVEYGCWAQPNFQSRALQVAHCYCSNNAEYPKFQLRLDCSCVQGDTLLM